MLFNSKKGVCKAQKTNRNGDWSKQASFLMIVDGENRHYTVANTAWRGKALVRIIPAATHARAYWPFTKAIRSRHICLKESNNIEHRKIKDHCHYKNLYWRAATETATGRPHPHCVLQLWWLWYPSFYQGARTKISKRMIFGWF